MKIFFREKTIILLDRPPDSDKEGEKIVPFRSRKQLKKVFREFVEDGKISTLLLYSESYVPMIPHFGNPADNPGSVFPDKGLLSSFLSLFKIIPAAGGVVFNEKRECLFIYRRGKWDLPKGKIGLRKPNADDLPPSIPGEFYIEWRSPKRMEKRRIREPRDEAALREVMEETGLKEIRIVRELTRTYHIYEDKGRWVLKPTTWFVMYAPGDQPLVPEEKEDISVVRWFPLTELETITVNTFALIRDLIVTEIPQIYPPGT
jgi:8-oxo-dGTP pyrophosphatase MutT (NUDIX family)